MRLLCADVAQPELTCVNALSATVSWLTSVWEYAAMAKRVGLVQARKAAGYTQESFTEELGVDQSAVVR
jgi:hypothetical protein